MKKIITVLASLLIFFNLQAEDNIKFYVEKALKNNLQLNAERKNFESAKQSKNISRSEFFPSVTLSGDQSSSSSKTDLAIQLSKDLKALGFKFIGPTVVYAHMQATGMVNDHLTSCPYYKV